MDGIDQLATLKTELSEAKANLFWANQKIYELELRVERYRQKDLEQEAAMQRCLAAVAGSD